MVPTKQWSPHLKTLQDTTTPRPYISGWRLSLTKQKSSPYVLIYVLRDCSDKNDLQKAEEQYKRTCKKFSHSSKVWTLYAEHLLRKGDVEDARKLLPRSLQSLEKRKRE